MSGEDFFKFNNGKEFRLSNFQEIKEDDLKAADEKTKKLFNIFAGEDRILQEVEARSLFKVLQSFAGDNEILEENEIKIFAKEQIGEEIDTNIFTDFVNNLFGAKHKTQNQPAQLVQNTVTSKSQQTFLKEAACKEIVIDILNENLSEAYEILNSQYLGSISGWYDEKKDKNDILKTSNVSKVLDYQKAGIEWMNKAKLAPPNGLTKREYYEGNKERIKDMILTRVLVLDTNTRFKELKNEYSEEELAEIIGNYVEQLCSNASMEDLKNIQKQFVSYNYAEEMGALEEFIDYAIKSNPDKNKSMPLKDSPLKKPDNLKGTVPEYWNIDFPILCCSTLSLNIISEDFNTSSFIFSHELVMSFSESIYFFIFIFGISIKVFGIFNSYSLYGSIFETNSKLLKTSFFIFDEISVFLFSIILKVFFISLFKSISNSYLSVIVFSLRDSIFKIFSFKNFI